MKGYFSNLTKQSGFYKAQRGAVESVPKNEPHLEKTVLVTPVDAQTEIPTTEKTAANNQITAGAMKDDAFKISSFGKKSGDKIFQAQEKREGGSSLAVERVVFKESADEKKFVAEFSESSVFPAGTVKEKVTESKQTQPEYFKKTSELLELGTANQLEIQRALLREAREWASNSPTAESLVNAEGGNEKRNEVSAVVLPIEKKLNVLQESFQFVGENSGNLHEQSFNLSIGSISITVEEPENKVQNEVVSKNRTTETNQSEKRRYSRLSRYYL